MEAEIRSPHQPFHGALLPWIQDDRCQPGGEPLQNPFSEKSLRRYGRFFIIESGNARVAGNSVDHIALCSLMFGR